MLYTVSADALQRFRLMIDTPAHEGVERAEVWSGYHIQESVAIFGPMPGIEPKSVASNLTPEFRQRLAELVSSKLATPTDSVRQLATLQFFFFNLVSDQHWDGIVIWANYIAELKVSGRDRAADAPAFENPAWNATLAEYCTFVRRVGVTTQVASDPRFTGPFTWLLHDAAADPASARQLGVTGRDSRAA